ncbi:MAG: nuclear transport factor 2 family protein [Gammaproteobacteria bacterium]|nr:nuclear transport factor 2 family protein [Gammaproteobacteria bacterium]
MNVISSADAPGGAPGDAAAVLAFVERSPAAVARHDRAAWIALFAADCVIEDPVGSRPHIAGDRRVIERFYDTFIEPNIIEFRHGRDYVAGLQVLRDLSLEIRMAPRVVIRVPMYLVYELCREGGELRIRRLAAHWELRPMLMQLLRCGIRGLPPALALGWRMIRLQGPGGTLGFMRAWRSVGTAGKSAVIAALTREDPPLHPVADAKVIAAGNHVTLRIGGTGVEGVFQATKQGASLTERHCWTRVA